MWRIGSLQSFIDYMNNVRIYHIRHDNLRYGQCMFNILHEMNVEWADEITGTELDPFYNDSHIPKFLEWLINKFNTLQQ